MSIRARLTIAIAAIFLLTVAVLGTMAVRTTRDTLIDQIDQQFNAGYLDVSPAQWGHLASEVMVRLDHVRQSAPSV